MINIDPDDIITVNEAAALLNCSPQNVKHHIARGNIPAEKVGQFWAINRKSITFFKLAKQKKIDLKKQGKKVKRRWGTKAKKPYAQTTECYAHEPDFSFPDTE